MLEQQKKNILVWNGEKQRDNKCCISDTENEKSMFNHTDSQDDLAQVEKLQQLAQRRKSSRFLL